MSRTDDGGPAFAFPFFEPSNDYGPGGWTAHTGMSLRDWFAGQALAGLIAKWPLKDEAGRFADYEADPDGFRAALTRGAYAYADAMLVARKKELTP